MQKEYNKIQRACDRIFDASPLAVNFVQKISTHSRAAVAPAPQGTRDQKWLPKQAATGLFKVGTSSRPPLLKAPGRPSVSYMDMFGKKANKSSDSSLGLVSKSDKKLSSKKQADVPSETSNCTRVERKNLSDPCIPRETTIAELGRLPGRYGLRTRERSEVQGASVNEAAAKPEKNIKSKTTTKGGPVKSSLIKVTEHNEASQDDDDVDSLSNHSDVESEESSDEEEDIKSKPTTKSGSLESSLNKVTEQNDASQGDDEVDSLSNHGEVESGRSSEEEEDIQSNQTSISGVVKSSLNTVTEQNEASQDDDDINTLSIQSEVESERSSDEEEVTDNSKTTNLQSNTRKIDNGPVVKHHIKRAQSRTKPISKQETETIRNTSYTKSQPARKDPEQRQNSLTVLRLTEPVETPKTGRGSHSQAHRQRGSDSGLERSRLTKSTKGSTSLKSTNDSLNRRVRGKGKKNLDTSRHKKILDSLSQKGTEKDPLAFTDLPQTRSGRRVKPPLAWWAGQRVFVHPHADIVEIKPPTPSNERDALSASMIHFKEDVELERSKRRMSRKLLAGRRKSKTSLNKSDNLKKKSLMEGSCHQTCRRVKEYAHHQNSGEESGDESQLSLHSVSTPLSRSMPLYKSDGVFSEEDVLEKFDTPGFPKHLRNPPVAARSRMSRFTARTLEVGDLEADDLCRSFGSTPVSQLVKRRTVEDRKRPNTVTELEEETLLRKAHQRKSKPPTADRSEPKRLPGRPRKNVADRSEPKRLPGRPRKNVTKETISNKLTKTHEEKMAVQDHKTSKKKMWKRHASPVDYSDESDTESVPEGHGRQLYVNKKQSNAASFQSSCSDNSDEEVKEELSPKPLTKSQRSNRRPNAASQKENVKKETLLRKAHQRKSKPPTAHRSEPKRLPGRPRKNVTKETISNKLTKTHEEKMAVQDHKTSKKKMWKRHASPVDYSDESDTESVQEGHGRQLYMNKKPSNAASFQSSCSDNSDEEVKEELSPKPLTKSQRSNRRPNAASLKENVNKRVNLKKNRKVASRVTEDDSDSDVLWEPPKKQRGKLTSSNERKKDKATRARPIMISDDEGVESIGEIEFTAQQQKSGRPQTKQEPNDGVEKSTAKSTSLKNAESKPLKKESKSRQGQAKKKVHPADINSESETDSKEQPPAPSSTKAKVFKGKENVKIRSSSDSVEDIWDTEEITLYKQALRQLNPSMDNFWYHVHLLVETKTAQQCQAYHQRCAPPSVQKKKPAPPPKADKGQKPGLTGKVGTLKRKRELKTMIEELNHNHEDDFFDATPVRQAKRLKLPTQDDEDDDDFYQNRPNTETPLSSRFTTPNPRLAWMPTSKTPVTSILSPSITNTVDRKNTEVYVHRMLTKRHKRLPAVGKIVEEQEPLHPETPKVAGSAVYQALFKKDTPQEVDSEVEEDYYFSDSN